MMSSEGTHDGDRCSTKPPNLPRCYVKLTRWRHDVNGTSRRLKEKGCGVTLTTSNGTSDPTTENRCDVPQASPTDVNGNSHNVTRTPSKGSQGSMFGSSSCDVKNTSAKESHGNNGYTVKHAPSKDNYDMYADIVSSSEDEEDDLALPVIVAGNKSQEERHSADVSKSVDASKITLLKDKTNGVKKRGKNLAISVDKDKIKKYDKTTRTNESDIVRPRRKRTAGALDVIDAQPTVADVAITETQVGQVHNDVNKTEIRHNHNGVIEVQVRQDQNDVNKTEVKHNHNGVIEVQVRQNQNDVTHLQTLSGLAVTENQKEEKEGENILIDNGQQSYKEPISAQNTRSNGIDGECLFLHSRDDDDVTDRHSTEPNDDVATPRHEDDSATRPSDVVTNGNDVLSHGDDDVTTQHSDVTYVSDVITNGNYVIQIVDRDVIKGRRMSPCFVRIKELSPELLPSSNTSAVHGSVYISDAESEYSGESITLDIVDPDSPKPKTSGSGESSDSDASESPVQGSPKRKTTKKKITTIENDREKAGSSKSGDAERHQTSDNNSHAISTRGHVGARRQRDPESTCRESFDFTEPLFPDHKTSDVKPIESESDESHDSKTSDSESEDGDPSGSPKSRPPKSPSPKPQSPKPQSPKPKSRSSKHMTSDTESDDIESRLSPKNKSSEAESSDDETSGSPKPRTAVKVSDTNSGSTHSSCNKDTGETHSSCDKDPYRNHSGSDKAKAADLELELGDDSERRVSPKDKPFDVYSLHSDSPLNTISPKSEHTATDSNGNVSVRDTRSAANDNGDFAVVIASTEVAEDSDIDPIPKKRVSKRVISETESDDDATTPGSRGTSGADKNSSPKKHCPERQLSEISRCTSGSDRGDRASTAESGSEFGGELLATDLNPNLKVYNCKRCGAGFDDLDPFERHVRTHTDRKPFECTKCGLAFSQRSTLICHMRAHGGKRSEKLCKFCWSTVTDASSLTCPECTTKLQEPCKYCGGELSEPHSNVCQSCAVAFHDSCKNCGTDVFDPDNPLCKKCTSSITKSCQTCSTRLTVTDRFCHKCTPKETTENLCTSCGTVMAGLSCKRCRAREKILCKVCNDNMTISGRAICGRCEFKRLRAKNKQQREKKLSGDIFLSDSSGNTYRNMDGIMDERSATEHKDMDERSAKEHKDMDERSAKEHKDTSMTTHEFDKMHQDFVMRRNTLSEGDSSEKSCEEKRLCSICGGSTSTSGSIWQRCTCEDNQARLEENQTKPKVTPNKSCKMCDASVLNPRNACCDTCTFEYKKIRRGITADTSPCNSETSTTSADKITGTASTVAHTSNRFILLNERTKSRQSSDAFSDTDSVVLEERYKAKHTCKFCGGDALNSVCLKCRLQAKKCCNMCGHVLKIPSRTICHSCARKKSIAKKRCSKCSAIVTTSNRSTCDRCTIATIVDTSEGPKKCCNTCNQVLKIQSRVICHGCAKKKSLRLKASHKHLLEKRSCNDCGELLILPDRTVCHGCAQKKILPLQAVSKEFVRKKPCCNTCGDVLKIPSRSICHSCARKKSLKAPSMKSVVAPSMKSVVAPSMKSVVAPSMKSVVAPSMKSVVTHICRVCGAVALSPVCMKCRGLARKPCNICGMKLKNPNRSICHSCARKKVLPKVSCIKPTSQHEDLCCATQNPSCKCGGGAMKSVCLNCKLEVRKACNICGMVLKNPCRSICHSCARQKVTKAAFPTSISACILCKTPISRSNGPMCQECKRKAVMRTRTCIQCGTLLDDDRQSIKCSKCEEPNVSTKCKTCGKNLSGSAGSEGDKCQECAQKQNASHQKCAQKDYASVPKNAKKESALNQKCAQKEIASHQTRAQKKIASIKKCSQKDNALHKKCAQDENVSDQTSAGKVVITRRCTACGTGIAVDSKSAWCTKCAPAQKVVRPPPNVCDVCGDRIRNYYRHVCQICTNAGKKKCRKCGGTIKRPRHTICRVCQAEEMRRPCQICGEAVLHPSYTICVKCTAEEKKPCRQCGATLSSSELVLCQKCIVASAYRRPCRKCGETITRLNTTICQKCKPPTKKPFPCTKCDKSFWSEESLGTHGNMHTGIRPYACTICVGVAFKRRRHLTDHMRTHTNERPYVCTLCNKRFRTSSNLRTHAYCHNTAKIFNCTECDSSFQCPKALHVHKKSHTGSSRMFPCSYCGVTFACSTALAAHVHTHLALKPYDCKVCKMKFTSASGLKAHMHKHSKDQTFKCVQCSRKFHSPRGLKDHMQSAHIRDPDRSLKCHVCDKRFQRTSLLKEHMYIHFDDKPYKCQSCSYSSAKPGELKAHLRSHTGERPFKCKYCDKGFARRTSLAPHLRAHLGIRPYLCTHETCTASFTSISHLIRHKVVHSQDKAFKCNQCEKAFSCLSGLTYHVRRHTNFKPLKCPHCPLRFVHHTDLRYHQERHDPKNKYVCNECELRFRKPGTLTQHMIRAHGQPRKRIRGTTVKQDQLLKNLSESDISISYPTKNTVHGSILRQVYVCSCFKRSKLTH